MPRRNSLLPRPIAPELVDIGDKVRVTHVTVEGVTRILEGVVGIREDHGNARHMMTAEGGRLFVWDVRSKRQRYSVELLERAPVEQAQLFTDLLDDTRDRIA